jgi:biopolymer transport protein ExbD
MQATLAAIKADHPTEDQVIITGDPTVPYEDVIHAMDAARAGPDGAMFPDVLFAAGLR